MSQARRTRHSFRASRKMLRSPRLAHKAPLCRLLSFKQPPRLKGKNVIRAPLSNCLNLIYDANTVLCHQVHFNEYVRIAQMQRFGLRVP